LTEPTPTTPPLPDPAGLERTLSPVDLPGDVVGEGAPVKWTAQIVAVASASLLLFNAVAIRSWASELHPGPWTDPIISAADAWYEATARIGLAAPVETMHGWWQRVQAARFGGTEPAAAPQDVEAPARPQPRPGESGPPTT
jgi:hypothetical protein